MARRFEIEPLGEARWARIERSLDKRMDAGEGVAAPSPPSARSVRPVAAFVLAGAAAAVIGAVAWESVRGHGRAAPPISRVATDIAPSHVELAGATVDVGPHSSVSVSGSDAEGLTLVLDWGDIDCEVMPRVGRPPFVVLSGQVSVRVVGTHFHVSRSGEATQVLVERGTVEVNEGDQKTPVHAGEQWPVAAVLESPPPRALPATSAVPAPAVVVARHGAPAPLASVPASDATPQETYERTIAIESSEPDAALAKYRELARGTGPWAMNALFAEGRLEAERGHDDEAKRVLDEYLRRFPSGPNASDARDLRARLR